MSINLKIGWIGTGVMGVSMCKHILKAGYSLQVSNRTMSKTEPLVELGAKPNSDYVSLANESDIVFLMLGFPKDVEEMVLGEKGILTHMKKGSILVDHTTSSPKLAEKIYNEAKKYNVSSYDVPVTGGDVGAREGKLVSFVGGDDTQFNLLKEILDTYSKSANLLGGPGIGQHTKMVNQIAICGNIQGLCEAMLYAYKAGLDVRKTIELISIGAAGSTQITAYGARMLNRDFEAGFFVDHFLKDIKIAIEESKRMGLDLKCVQLAGHFYEIMVEMGLDKKGHHGLLLGLEKLNGIVYTS